MLAGLDQLFELSFIHTTIITIYQALSVHQFFHLLPI